jgi:hypothetical protein
MDESVCKTMQSSQAIVSHSVDAKELFTKIITKVKAEVEYEKKDDNVKDDKKEEK